MLTTLGLAACLLWLAPTFQSVEEDSVDSVTQAFYDLQRKAQKQLAAEDLLPLIERLWKIHDQSESDPGEFAALEQVLRISVRVADEKLEKEWRDAVRTLEKEFLDDDRMMALVMNMPSSPKLKAEAESFLGGVQKKTTNSSVQAAFVMKEVRTLLDQESRSPLDDAGMQKLTALMDRLKSEFPAALEPTEKVAYSEFVPRTMNAVKALRIGAPAMEIHANDLDGVPFKLSDYRGKVVLLDFWGYW